MRVDRAKPLSGLAVAEQLHGRERRMRRKQAQQLTADIARGSKDGRPNHEKRLFTRLHIYARECILMR